MITLRHTLLLLLGFTLLSGHLLAQTEDRSRYNMYFESAAAEFGVPADVLRGVAFSTTRWSQLTWADGDTVSSCMGVPRIYGVMGLWDNYEFGHTLREAAALIGRDVQELKSDPFQNIRGGAALLRKLYDDTPMPSYAASGMLESWENAIARYTGIPQPELSHGHVLDLFTRIEAGYHRYGIDIDARPMNLEPIRQSVKKLQAEAAARAQVAQLKKTTGTPDYPLAKWVAGTPGIYYGENDGFGKVFVVIHDMEGYYASVVSGFQTRTDASVHYCLNSAQDNAGDGPAGEITQLVEEKYYAWHAITLNRYSLGIEHEGFANNPAWFTDAMYLSSSKLVKYMCDKYNIPKDRNHIVAHGEWQNAAWDQWLAATYPAIDPYKNTHTDPGPYWDWSFYMQMIRQDTTVPHVTSTPPTAALQVYDKIRIMFSERMDRATVEKNFSITPAVPGAFVWETDNRTMTFSPNVYMAFNTQYTVVIDTGAHNYFAKGLDQTGDGAADKYSFSFKTVATDAAAPTVTATYPRDKQTDVSPSATIRITFSEVMDASTLDNAIVLKDSTGTKLTLTKTVSTQNGATLVIATPAPALLPNAAYTLAVTQDAKDLSANALNATQSRSFTTVAYPKLNGTVLNTIDATGGWWQPSASGSTVNVISSFAIVGSPKFNGTGAGMITYAWQNSSGGMCREHYSTTPSVEGGSIVGIWVYGDNSGNGLELWFYYNNKANFIAVSAGTIDWTGWKLVTVPVSAIPGPTRMFASFVIVQKAGAAMSGMIGIDDLSLGTSVTGVKATPAAEPPSAFTLAQNFPNPFNPSTHFQFSLPTMQQARLSVYDVLGREVAVLVNEALPAGSYAIEWNAHHMTSGVYFYTLTAGNYSATKKLLLTK
jgi:N-acetyl-anhydromuramyl-L-alanine amidase AmpD/methionine-rich copper-binding protein CopC